MTKPVFYAVFLFSILTHSFSAEAKSVKIVALGDSTTAGTPGFRSPLEAPPNGSGNPQSQYGYWIMQRHPDWEVLNRGVAGERTGQIAARFDRDVIDAKADIVIVLAGVNDIYQGYPTKDAMRYLETMYRRAREANIHVVAATILPYNSAGREQRLALNQINEWIRSYARQNRMGFCDTYRAAESEKYPGNLAGSPDGIHPDVETYRKIGNALAEALERENWKAS
jgi:lysophospholipase L1-like esterase